jgi:hypothetical protein
MPLKPAACKARAAHATRLPHSFLPGPPQPIPSPLLNHNQVTTSDGFILRMFRIPHGLGGPEAAAPHADHHHGNASSSGAACGAMRRPIALMQHALMDSSAGWVLQGPGRALAFQLAEAGYDVWLANSRGA